MLLLISVTLKIIQGKRPSLKKSGDALIAVHDFVYNN